MVEGFKKQRSKTISFPVATSVYCTSTHDNVCALGIENVTAPFYFYCFYNVLGDNRFSLEGWGVRAGLLTSYILFGRRKSDIPPTKEHTAEGQHRKPLYIFIFYSRGKGGRGGVTPIAYIIFNIFNVIRTISSYVTVVTQRQRGLLVKTNARRLV